MSNEAAIRHVIDAWLAASEGGHVDAVLKLMADDVVFLAAGQKPFGKEQFAASFRAMNERGVRMQARSDLKEVVVAGDWAWCRSELQVTVTPPSSPSVRRSGPTLTIFRKTANGAWVIARDANLLTLESAET